MAQNGVSASITPTDFKNSFDASLIGLITEEWPAVKSEELEGTAGDMTKVVDLVSTRTDHTKALVKKQLGELVQMRPKADDKLQRMKDLMDRLESKTEDLVKYARTDMVPEAQQKMRDNLLVTILVTLGFGVLLGFVVKTAASRR